MSFGLDQERFDSLRERRITPGGKTARDRRNSADFA
jgi:hypothetical protein